MTDIQNYEIIKPDTGELKSSTSHTVTPNAGSTQTKNPKLVWTPTRRIPIVYLKQTTLYSVAFLTMESIFEWYVVR